VASAVANPLCLPQLLVDFRDSILGELTSCPHRWSRFRPASFSFRISAGYGIDRPPRICLHAAGPKSSLHCDCGPPAGWSPNRNEGRASMDSLSFADAWTPRKLLSHTSMGGLSLPVRAPSAQLPRAALYQKTPGASGSQFVRRVLCGPELSSRLRVW